MRNPFRTEAEAFSFVLVCVALFAAVAVAGIFFGGWVALGVFLVLAVGVALYVKARAEAAGASRCVPREARRPPPDPRRRERDGRRPRASGRDRPPRGRGRRRARRLSRPQLAHPALGLRRGRRAGAGGASGSASPWPPSRRRGSTRAARSATPTRCRRWTTRSGRSAQTRSSSPRTRPGRSNWLEKGVIERARERYRVPITHVVVDLELERLGGQRRRDGLGRLGRRRACPGRRSGRSPRCSCRPRWPRRRPRRPRPGR